MSGQSVKAVLPINHNLIGVGSPPVFSLENPNIAANSPMCLAALAAVVAKTITRSAMSLI
jgi:hypothetical protein